MKKLFSALVLVCLFFTMTGLSYVAEAETTADFIDAAADTFVHNGRGNNNFGGADKILTASANNAWSREIFFKFDLSDALKKDYIITKAELSMQCVGNGTNNQPYEIYYVSDDSWTEGNKNNAASNVSTDLTWNNSREIAKSSVKIFDNGGKRPSLTLGELTYSDITNAVLNEEDGTLSLRLITRQNSGTNTIGVQIYSKESSVAAECKPRIRLTVENDPDKVAVYKDKEAIELGNLTNVTGDITLPKTGSIKGSSITWESTNSDVLEIVDNGDTYTAKYKAPQEAVDVTLTAAVSSGAETDTKEFIVNVGNVSSTELDYAGLSVDYDPLSKAVNLPTTGEYGSTISWSSSDTSVIAVDGQVTRPYLSDEAVKLTAEISKTGDETKYKEFDVTVPALGYLLPSKDTRMHIDNKGANSSLSFGNDEVIITSEGSGRKAVVGFDLSEVNGAVKKATVYLTKSDSNRNYIDVNYVPNDDWEEGNGGIAEGNVICGNNYDDLIVPRYKVSEFYTNEKNLSFDITAAVQKELAGDKMLSLEIVKSNSYINTDLPAGKNTTSYPSNLYTKEHSIADYAPENEDRMRVVFEYTTDDDEITLISELADVELPGKVNRDFELPQSTKGGYPITWTSSAPEYIANDGRVTAGETDTSVKMTASAEKNGKTVTKDFYVVVRNAQMPFAALSYIYKTADGNLTSSVSVNGELNRVIVDSFTNESADLYFAVYDQSGSLVTVKKCDIEEGTFGSIKNYLINYKITSNEKSYTYKTIILSDDGNIKPLALYK